MTLTPVILFAVENTVSMMVLHTIYVLEKNMNKNHNSSYETCYFTAVKITKYCTIVTMQCCTSNVVRTSKQTLLL